MAWLADSVNFVELLGRILIDGIGYSPTKY